MRVLREGAAAGPHEAERLRLAVEAIGIGTWYLDLRTGAAMTDARFAEMTAIGPGSVPDGLERFVERFYRGDRAAFDERVRAATETGNLHALHRLVETDGSARWIEGWGRPVWTEGDASAEPPTGMIGVLLDVTERRETELERIEQGAWMGKLQQVTAALAARTSLPDVVDVLTDLVPAAVGARHMTLRLVSEDGGFLLPIAATPSVQSDSVRLGALPIQGDMPITHAVRTGEPVFDVRIGDILRRMPEFTESARAIGAQDDDMAVALPLRSPQRVVGVIALTIPAENPIGANARDFLLSVADQAAQVVERARAFEAEGRARADAEESRSRLEELHAITEAALANVRLEDGLQRMLEIVVDAAGADVGAVVLHDEDSHDFRLKAVIDDHADLHLDAVVDPGGTLLQRVVAGERVRADDLISSTVPPHATGSIASLLAMPLRASGNVLGWLHVGSHATVARDGDADLVRLAAEQIGIAVDRARLFEREHRIAETLQRSLLPETLPDLPGVALAARYLPGSGDAQVGGDWFEVVELPDGRIAAAVGDVVGSGVRAAAAMGQFRNAMRALALEGLGSSRLLERLGDLATGLGREFATAFTLVLDPTTGMIRYSSAGHPPALILRGDGTTTFLDAANSTPLGVEPGTAYPEAAYPLDEGDTVILYTDGLIERRAESLDVGFERLRSAAGGQGSVETLVGRLIEELVRPGHREDDIAVLAMRFLARPLRFELSLPPTPASVAAFRSAFSTWLEEAGVGGSDALDLTLAVSEACSNAVEHAGDTSNEVALIAELRDDDAMVAVRDGGRWRPPSLRPERGRGFLILRQVMDSIDVRRRPGGTEIRMHRRVGVRS